MSNLARLWRFYPGAFIHMVFYRALIISALLTFVLFVLYMIYSPLWLAFELILLADWILFTTQVYESARAFVDVGSRGLALGRLNRSFVNSMMGGERARTYAAMPPVLACVWLVGLLVFAAMVIL